MYGYIAMLSEYLVTMVWHVLRLQMVETASRYIRYILSNQLWTANKEWSSSLKARQGTNNLSLEETSMLWNATQGLRLGWIPWVDSCEHGDVTSGSVQGMTLLDTLSDYSFPKRTQFME
jgi:hypothetical protein